MATNKKTYSITLKQSDLDAINGQDGDTQATSVDAVGIDKDGNTIDKIGINILRTNADVSVDGDKKPDEIEEPVETVVVDDEIGNVNPEEVAAGASESLSESKLFNFNSFLKKK
jgi:hypothetical protein